MIVIQPLTPYPPDYCTPLVKLHLVNRVIKLTGCRNEEKAVAKTGRMLVFRLLSGRPRASYEGRTAAGRELAGKTRSCVFRELGSERGGGSFLDLDAGRGREFELVAGERYVFVLVGETEFGGAAVHFFGDDAREYPVGVHFKQDLGDTLGHVLGHAAQDGLAAVDRLLVGSDGEAFEFLFQLGAAEKVGEWSAQIVHV